MDDPPQAHNGSSGRDARAPRGGHSGATRERTAPEEFRMPLSKAPQSAVRNDGCTTLPSRVSPVPVTSSSSQSNATTPVSPSTNGDTKL